jgi:ribA/ribD-fused uncharacterized protein
MNYSISQLLKEQDEGVRHKYLFFWGHQPSQDGQVTKSCFSQWWHSPFITEGISYTTAEHWMMAKKALLFDDKETYQKILKARTPGEAKRLGRSVQNYDEDLWCKRRMNIVIEGNFHKFSQHSLLGNFLEQTNSRVLVEASPSDCIWGIGLMENNLDASYPEKWKGTNLLGFALMHVRDKLNQ